LPLPYVHAVTRAGGAVKVLSTFEELASEEIPDEIELHAEIDPYDSSHLEGASGLVLCGGGDVDPQLYGRKRHPRTHNVSQRRDRFELTMIGAALEQDMPMLAICRGMQLLNVHLGGALDQHLLDTPGRFDHYRDRPLAEAAHDLSVKEGSLLAEIVGSLHVKVNTHHHQGLEAPAGPLEEIAWAEDGVLEAVESREHSWVLGVQWHPEAMAPVDRTQARLFEAFVDAVRHYEARETEVTARSA
jgi:putative glutamine amidotransferase